MTEANSRSQRAPRPGLARKLLGNYVFQLLNQGIGIGQQLILVPMCLYAWGVEVYGTWNVLYSIAALATSFNFGIEYYFAAAFVRHAAQHRFDLLSRQFRIALFCAVTAAIMVLAIFLCGIGAIDIRSVLNIRSMDSWAVYTVLIAMAFPVLVLLPAQILHGLYRAYGDFNRGEAAFALYNILQLGVINGLLLLRQPPWVVAICIPIVPFVFAACLTVDIARRYRNLEFGITVPTLSDIKTILPQTSLYFLDPLSLLAIQHGPLLLFGLLNTSATAIISYTVYRTFTGLARQSASLLAVGGGIEMARQLARGESDACRILYHNMGRAVAGLMGALAGISIPVSGPFVSLWTHGAVGYEELLLLCFLGGGFLASPGQAAVTVLRYTNRVKSCAAAWSAHALVGLTLGIALVPTVGVAGAAAGFAVSEFLAIGLYLPIYVQRSLGFSAFRHWLTSYSVGIASFALSFAVARLVLGSGSMGLMELVARSAAWGTIMVILAALIFMLRRATRADDADRSPAPSGMSQLAFRQSSIAGPSGH